MTKAVTLDPSRSAALWGERCRMYLEAMDAAQHDGFIAIAESFEWQAVNAAIYAGTCARLAREGAESPQDARS